jgi:hypothetical protein
MAINPNIALGIQQPQQPNMLGQYAQVMAIRAAQQEMEGNEGFRSALAGGMEATDPRILQYGRPGRETFKAAGEGRIKQLEAASKSNEILGGIFGGVLQDPTTGPQAVARLQSMGLMTEAQAQKVIAEAGNNPDAWRQLAKPYYEGAISAAQRLTAETSRYSTNVAAGTAANRLNFDREKFTDERLRGKTIAGNNQFLREDVYGNLSPVGSFGTQFGPNAPAAAPALPPAAANAFVASRPPVNALAPTAAPQGAGPTVAAAAALDQQANIPRPKQPFRAPVAVMQDNQAVLVPADKAIGMQPATAFTEKQAFGKTETVRNLGTAIANLTDAIKPGGLLEKSTGSGLGRAMDVSAGFFGQATEGAIAAAKLAPIADLVLKMVPRFEGPQSDKDTQSYKEAAGQLANASLPNEIRKGAAEVIIKLMKERRDQFGMTDQVGGSGGAGATADPLGIR